MEIALLLLVSAVFIILLVAIYLILNSPKDTSSEAESRFLRESLETIRLEMTDKFGKNSEILQNRLDSIRDKMDQRLEGMQKTVGEKMDYSSKAMNERLDKAAAVIGGVQNKMGEISKLPAQIQDLQNIFQKTKSRGIAGEIVMESLITDSLPKNSYTFQYKFTSGATVDAVIKTKQGMIPIDAKFPLDNFVKMVEADNEKDKETYQGNFRNDVRKKIRDIRNKYIIPAESTMDFACMYIPSESMFYEIMVNDDELELYLRDNKILALSPNTLFYFIRVIMLGFEGQQVEQNAKIILNEIKNLQQDAEKFAKTLSTLGSHIGNAKSKMDEVGSDFDKIKNRLDRASSLQIGEKTQQQMSE